MLSDDCRAARALLLETAGAARVPAPRLFLERLRAGLEQYGAFVEGVPLNLKLRGGGVTYETAPVVAAQGVLHEVELAFEVAKKSGCDHFVMR